MGKWKEGWHPTSRVSYPKLRSYYQLPTKKKRKMWLQYRNKANNIVRPGYRTQQEEFSISMYCWELELMADIKIEERRLKEYYAESLHS